MKRYLSLFIIAAFCAALTANSQEVQKRNTPPMLGIHWAKGIKPAHGGGSPDMTWHGGDILPTAFAQTIFWGSSWGSPGDKISGMDSWYSGFGGSNYAGTSDEYTGLSDQVGSSVTYGGHFIDTTKAAGGNNTSTILAEVCKVIPTTDLKTNGYYAVYTDLPRKGNYCAYHSWGSCSGVNIQFAFFWKLDGDAGCDPQSTVAGESQGLQALANVSGHELSETRTDPRGTAWFDSSGGENGDKCNFTFGAPFVTFKNGTQWKIQGEWSNHAFDTNSGYPNSSGQKGCLQGQ